MGEIADQMSTALGDVGSEKATATIAKQMQKLLAADVLYSAVARPEINGVLADNGIEGDDVPKSDFLPDGTNGSTKARSAPRSARSAARPAPQRPGVHGLGLIATSINGTELVAESTTAVAARRNARSRSRSPEPGRIDRERHHGLGQRHGGTTLQENIGSIGAGETATVTIPLTPRAERRSDARSRSRAGAGRAGLRKQRSQLHGRIRIEGWPMKDRLPRPGRDVHRRRAAGGAAGEEIEPLRTPTVHDAILAVERGEAERAFVPFENSIEGSVRSTLDTLAFDTEAVTIVGEHDFAVRAHLIAREGVELEQVEAVLSHPQPLAQCARFLRESLPGVERRSVSSTADAVRMVSESERPWAAIGARSAAELYGCASSARGSRTRPTTSPASSGSPPPGPRSAAAGRGRPRWSSPSSARTTPAPWSTRCREFSGREVNLTPDRVASAAPRPRPLHVLLRPRGRRGRAGRRGGDRRRCGPRPNRCGSSAPIPWAEQEIFTGPLRKRA